MSLHLTTRRFGRILFTACALAASVAAANAQGVAAPSITLPGHVPPAVATAHGLSRADPTQRLSVAIVLPLRNQGELQDLLDRLYDPTDPDYGQYLSPLQFANEFGPSQADYQMVADFATANGLNVVATHSNRLVLDVEGPIANLQRAFQVQLIIMQGKDGRVFRAPTSDPIVPASLAGRISAVVGLDNAAVAVAHNIRRPQGGARGMNVHTTGSGPGGGMTPTDIRTAYALSTLANTGTGQSTGLFELDGYNPNDIRAYEAHFNLPNVVLQNVLVDGATGAAGGGADEVTLDIELQIAIAPGISRVMVYEGPNTSNGSLDTYTKIATDNIAQNISTSWGLPEVDMSASARNSENTIFQEYAAQGQSLYAASGDDGADDNGFSLGVDDPASQPFVTGVGGTSLTTNGPGGAWKSETTWNGGSPGNGAGGGGISVVWPIPSYQSGLSLSAAGGSTSNRNVPDVSLNADPNQGYAIFVGGSWQIYGGTSCAAPLWAGFTALVNQGRITAGSPLLGFANTPLYKLGTGTNYAIDFHDIADNSTNLFYHAVKGYDLATGWGTIDGVNLLPALGGALPGSGGGGGGGNPPPPPMQILGDPGFENGLKTAPWVATVDVLNDMDEEPTHSGNWDAWLDGYDDPHTDTLSQQASIPFTITTATLTFWLHVDTSERPGVALDTLTVQIRNTNGLVLKTLATFSNLNQNNGYTQEKYDLSAYKGQTIVLYFTGKQTTTRETSFVLDDFALLVQ